MRGTRRPLAELTYAKSRTWSLARKPFNLHELSTGRRGGWNGSRYVTIDREVNSGGNAYRNLSDHCACYVWEGTEQPAAIIAHPYGYYTEQEIQAVARRCGVMAEVFRPSWWHNPDGQTIILSAPRDGPIRRAQHR